MLNAGQFGMQSGASPVALALVGIGRQGRRHLASALRMSAQLDIRLAALVDIDPRCEAEAGACGTPFYADINALPQSVDACVVATPTATHFDLAGALLRRGFDVLLEKPVASHLAQTQGLVRLAEKHRRILQVGYLERHHPAFTLVQPDFSLPAQIVSHRSTTGRMIRSLPDLVLELMIHDLDMICAWLNREPNEIAWRSVTLSTEQISGVLELGFDDGHRARLFAKSGAHSAVRRTSIRGGGQTWEFRWGRAKPAVDADLHLDPLSRQLRAFVHAVRTRSSPSIDGHSALRAMRVAQRAIQALDVAA